MNKKLANYFSSLGLQVEANRAYGTLRGFEVSVRVSMAEMAVPVQWHVAFYATEEQHREILSQLTSLKLKQIMYNPDAFGLWIGMNDHTVGRLVKRMPDILDAVFGALARCGAVGAGHCPVCGNELAPGAAAHDVNGFIVTVDDECLQKINSAIEEENQNFEAAPDHIGKGALGALLGGLVGVAVAIAFAYFGIISALSGVVAVLLGMRLYQKFGGKPTGAMIAIVSFITVFLMLGTTVGIYIVESGQIAREAEADLTAIEAFKILMTDAEFVGAFMRDILFTLGLTALAIVFEISAMRKKIQREKTIQ